MLTWAGRLLPNPISSEAPAVGDTVASNPWDLLDVTHLEADLSHREVILHCLVPCTSDSWAGWGWGGWFFKPNSDLFGVVESRWDTEQWEMLTSVSRRTAGLEKL